LKSGNIILKVRDRPISGVLELKNALVGIANPVPPSRWCARNGKNEVTIDVRQPPGPAELSRRPPAPDGTHGRPDQPGARFVHPRDPDRHAAAAGPNRRAGGGSEGRVVGITMARADRTRSFVMPAAAIQELLKTDATDPALAQVAQVETLPEIPLAG
jgi:hypothetical protein